MPTQIDLKPAFHVGPVPIYGDLVLSPMDGYSDWPFRSICRQLGSAISYTEFVNVDDILVRPDYVAPRLFFTPDEHPVAIQIYGDDPERLLAGALKAQELGPDFIDINMGCPSKSIANRGAGAGLMRTPLKIARIFRKLKAFIQVPITAKIRLGWDEDCLTYPLVARIVEENGGQLLAVHARTKAQGYKGRADWDAIAAVVEAVSIPVIGNGDVNTCADIQRMLDHTGCAGVMIGRAATYNPWIFSRIDRQQVNPRQVRKLIQQQLQRNLEFYGPEYGLVLFRKYASRYLSPYRLSKEHRQKLLTRTRPEDFMALLDEIDLSTGSEQHG